MHLNCVSCVNCSLSFPVIFLISATLASLIVQLRILKIDGGTRAFQSLCVSRANVVSFSLFFVNLITVLN